MAATNPDPNFHLYLLAGQSNMAGRGKVEPIDTITQANILMLDKNNVWRRAKSPLHFDKPVAGVGPGLAFAQELIKANPKVKIGLIPAAHGGSSIDAWVKGGYHDQTKGYPYDEAITRTKVAMQTGILKGIIWHQGESDSGAEPSKMYLNKLATLIQNFRVECNAPAVPFVAGELGYYHDTYNNINQELSKLPALVPITAIVKADGLIHGGDGIHFDAASAREYGKRYAYKMLELQKTSKNK